MKTLIERRSGMQRPVALLLAASMTVPTLAGCGGGGSQAPNNDFQAPPPGMGQTAQRQGGMSGKQKMMLLAGAAALYYIYKKRQNAQQAAGPNGKYFLSESTGRVYYRDLKSGKFQWVSPPRQAIQVPADEAQQYSQYQGYNNQSNGQTFGGYGANDLNRYRDAVPAQPMF